MQKIYSILFLVFLVIGNVSAQTNETGMPRMNPMAIPSSPAFSLLGVNPEIVTRPSDVKEFKVDWRIKNYKLAPDLALEAQPLWWLYFRKKSPAEYTRMSPLARVLSTASVSLATAKIDNVNHLSYAVKLNVYKENDPFLNSAMINEKEAEINKLSYPLNKAIDSLMVKRSKALFQDTVDMIDAEIKSLTFEKNIIRRTKMEEFQAESSEFIFQNWNMDMVDIAFGRVFKYDNAALDSLNFDRAGYGVWVNAAKGIGKNGLLSGILRYNRIGQNNNYMFGASYRYGSQKYNFFAEFVLHRISNNVENGFDEDEQFANLRAEDIGMGWYKFADAGEPVNYMTMSYGGDFRLNRSILLNFALRTDLTNKLNFKRFLPIANIVCLMN